MPRISRGANRKQIIMTLAFKNCKYNKSEAVTLAVRHYKQDAYMRGTYGKDTPEGWKGCSVGCMAKGDHADYPKLFGIDTRVAWLSDTIFEGLGQEDYKSFTVKLFKSVKAGSDTLLSWYRFQHWLIMDSEHGLILSNDHASVKHIGELFSRAGNSEIVTLQQWEEAASANAAYAAGGAAAAAYAAGGAAAAAYAAAYAAGGAAAAAASAAYAAAYAADAAAKRGILKADFYRTIQDKLCYFLAGGV